MPKNKKKFSKKKDFEKKENKGYKPTKEKELDTDKGVEYNAAIWLAPNDLMLKQIGSFPFESTIGVPIQLFSHFEDSPTQDTTLELGNIMEIDCFPCFDNASGTSRHSGLDSAALKFYNEQSSMNNKTTKYLPEDIAMSIIAVGEVVSAVAHFARSYGLFMHFNPRNRTFPSALIQALGFQPDDFKRGLANARMRFNALLARASNIKMYDAIPYLEKCRSMYENIFYDKGSSMGQYYVMRPSGFLMFHEGEIDPETGFYTGQKLKFRPWAEGGYTLDQYLNLLEEMINRILQSSLFNYVFTDIVNTASKLSRKVVEFQYLPEMYATIPIFSEEFMNQIHNMTWDFWNLSEDYEITDDPTTLTIVSNLSLNTIGAEDYAIKLATGDVLIDFPFTDNPTPEDIVTTMEYVTVLDGASLGIDQPQWKGRMNVKAIPDHPVDKVYIWPVSGSGGTKVEIPRTHNYPTGVSKNEVRRQMLLSTFDVRPFCLYNGIATTELNFTRDVLGELNYFTVMSAEQAFTIHDYALLGLFSIEYKGLQSI